MEEKIYETLNEIFQDVFDAKIQRTRHRDIFWIEI